MSVPASNGPPTPDDAAAAGSMRPRGARWWRLLAVIASFIGLLIPGLGIEFFTTQSNAIVIGYLVVAIVVGWGPRGRTPAPRLRGAVTSWILITAIANQVVLAGDGDPVSFLFAAPTDAAPAQVANLLVHYVVPAMVLIDWIVWRPRIMSRWRDAALWTVYPIAYVGLIVLRGALLPQVEDRYPYPFLDPAVTGWPGPTTALPVVLLLMVAIPFAVVTIEKALLLAARGVR